MASLWTLATWGLLILAAAIAAWAILSDPARGRLRCPGGWRRALLVLPWRQGCWYDMSGVARRHSGAGPDAATAHGSGTQATTETAQAAEATTESAKGSEAGESGIALPCRCPECGREWRRERSLTRRRVRWWGVALAAALALGAYPASVMPRMQKHGVWAGVPTWALAVAAPMDGFARGSLGCRVSWNTMPDMTRELVFPKWERRYASWETAIIKWRAERAVERVRGEFPGRDAVFIPLAKYESEGWPTGAGRMVRNDSGAAYLARFDRAAGLLIVGDGADAVGRFLATPRARDVGER